MQQIRLLTANLWNGRADPLALADVIAERQPDAVLAQELSPEQAAVIERALPHGILMPARDMQGMGIALREPAMVSRLPLPKRDALCARLRLPGASTEIEIMNLHLSAPTALGRFGVRRREVSALRAHLRRTSMPRVLAGDFNTLPVMPAYFALRRHLRDAALETRRRPAPTWGPTARAPRLLRIDHVMVHGLRVIDLEVLAIAGSDHSAIFATLALP
ncbi:MAG: endonuclease/exonuclease/phosphatase family protein [Polyangiales bacterium]